LRIVDRKKELLIMSNGKNVAPQPIENALKGSRYLESAMLIGDRRNFISALLVPNFEALKAFAAEAGLSGLNTEALLAHPQIQGLYRQEVETACEPFAKFEKVKKFTLSPRPFEAERNELTPTLKIKRRVVIENFASEIERMYEAEAVSA
jgi:long-chain acyl-CoA synthetase